jgi:protein tyrosine/serine phosphatase
MFRSDVLYRLTGNDSLALSALGIRTVIDLRSTGEVNHYPESPLKLAGLQHFNVPITTDEASATGSLAEDYLLLLRNAHEGFREVFGHLANDHFPLVMNCFAGKDRTGLTCALVLGALGVPDDVIAADYAFSEQHMARLMHIHRRPEVLLAEPGVLPTWLAATSETMVETLHAISAEWGSVHGYLESIGIPAEELRRICEALVECASEQPDQP